MFLVDKYPIQGPDDLFFNNDMYNELMYIASNENIPHIIISGQKGSGKQSLLRLFLEALFDKSVNRLRKVRYPITGSSSKKDTVILQSNYHIVINPTNTNLDKHIIQDIVKQYATIKSFNIFETKRSFKVIVIHNIDMLAASSQAAMRRTMEKYADSCRFILSCNNPSMTWESLRSRCTIISLRPPTLSQIGNVITRLAIREDFLLSKKQKQYIMDNCRFNLRIAIWIMECIMIGKTDKLIPLDNVYEDIINDIIGLKDEKTLSSLFKRVIEEKVEQIIINNINKSKVMEMLLQMLIQRINNDNVLQKIIEYASESEYFLVKGRRDIVQFGPFISGTVMELEKCGYAID